LVHFSVANSQLGHFYYDQNKLELATPYLAADLDASRKIAGKDKTSADKKFDLAKSLLMMASINQNLQGNLDEASTLMADLAKDHALTPGEADLAQGIENLKASLPAK
jgi:hypothetical protein